MRALLITISFLFSFLLASETIHTKKLSKDIHKVRESTILYKLKQNVTSKQLKSFNSLINASTLIEKKELKGLKIKLAKVKNIKGKELDFSKKLFQTGAVHFAEPDMLVPHTVEPNDQFYYVQWHHGTINSESAWDLTTGSNAIKVCVLDTGVDSDHPDLVNNLLLPGYNAYIEEDGNIEDLYGHGSGTAGVVSAVGNNSIGVAGVNWNVKIIPVQISQGSITSSAYISDMAVGIRWCADNGARVANLSYGGAQYSTISDAAQYLKDKGGLLFMSAGNDGVYHSAAAFPDYPSFIIVGSTSDTDTKSSFSEYGPYIDLVAPGEDIATTYLDASYVYYTGTSFSSPMAAGVAALVLSANPSLTVDQLEDVMLSSAVDLGDVGEDDLYGKGRIDALAAVTMALSYGGNQAPTAVANSNTLSGFAPLTVNFNSNGSNDIEDGSNITYLWDFGDGNNSSDANPSHIYNEVGIYNVSLVVTDTEGLSSNPSVLEIDVLENVPVLQIPTITNAVVNEDLNTVTLSWEHDLENSNGFEVYRAKKRRGKFNFDPIVTLGLVKTFVDENVDQGSYRYKIKALSNTPELDNSDFSNTVAVSVETGLPTDPVDPVDPVDPTGPTTPTLESSLNGNTVTLTWTTCDGCSYKVERAVKTKGKATFDPNYMEQPINESFLIIEEEVGSYSYRVYSIKDSQNSDFSNTVSVRIR